MRARKVVLVREGGIKTVLELGHRWRVKFPGYPLITLWRRRANCHKCHWRGGAEQEVTALGLPSGCAYGVLARTCLSRLEEYRPTKWRRVMRSLEGGVG